MISLTRKRASTAEVLQDKDSTQSTPIPPSAPHAAFPRVNLIPDEIAHEARIRRAQLMVAGSVLASLIVVAGLYALAAMSVGSAQQQLDQVSAQSVSLSTEVAKYADVPKVISDLASARNQQASAMGGEVRWSLLLNNLALSIPTGTAINSLKGTITGSPLATAEQAALGGPAPVTSVLGKTGVGSIQFEGEALDNGHVSNFLEAISRNTGLTDPFATLAATDQRSPGGAAISHPSSVRFTATVTIDGKALSHRYDVKGS